MAYTKFGEFMRILRVQHHEVMGDVAKLLNVSTPFLSAVENGKKNVPEEWFAILTEHYSLSDMEIAKMKEAAENSKTQVKISIAKMKEAAENSRTQVKISLSNTEAYQRETALQFARSFEGIDEDTALKILELLKKGKQS